ncbi:uncharacterized protein FMAN_13477 [Fusarium mangiferae]|uniref:Uncharacterized protein n=1 Tax=Fusarium mangiferae TaxID=192010 RepID=A0A1L7T9G8_FUSMA|nr:uncharacterized protein FMAN_13477 [Fusarium mangiferae]CVK95378.1 uncharacterized protein FMAN_13477 [Fusarium mangiferae]
MLPNSRHSSSSSFLHRKSSRWISYSSVFGVSGPSLSSIQIHNGCPQTRIWWTAADFLQSHSPSRTVMGFGARNCRCGLEAVDYCCLCWYFWWSVCRLGCLGTGSFEHGSPRCFLFCRRR